MVARAHLKAPFPWFGGKSRAAHLVWPRFGNVVNYVEPFAGSLAVMLMRPAAWPAKNETVNDLDCFVANFWRALQHDPDAVAAAADWPVNEADLHARHQWLHAQAEFRERMHTDPDYYDVKIAGWWVWGLSAWIGDNWCRTKRQEAHPELHEARGVCAFRGDGTGLDRRRPNIGSGNGVHAKMPDISGHHGASGRGVHCGEHKRVRLEKGGVGVQRQMPDVSGDGGASGKGTNAAYARGLYEYMRRLAERLRYVRVCCGDWSRILGPSPTVHIGITGVFLDPPYGVDDRDKVYNHDGLGVAPAVRAWCREHGADKRLRIALCGYEGEHEELEGDGWDVVAWKAGGGYAARGPRKANAERERIWFSPGCLAVDDQPLFAGLSSVVENESAAEERANAR